MAQITPVTYEAFLELAAKGTVVPVIKTVMADLLTPVSAFLKIQDTAKLAFLLESVEGGEKIARYSFLGINPHRVIRAKANNITIENADGTVEQSRDSMTDILRHMMESYEPVKVPNLPPFTGGGVGFFGYDAVHWFERLPHDAPDDLGVDTATVMFYSSILAFDHVKHQIQIIVNVFTDGKQENLESNYQAACREIIQIEEILKRPTPIPPPVKRTEPARLKSNMTKEEFEAAVKVIQEYILAGDAFQIVFSQRFEANIATHPFQIYRALRAVNPSPYMFYLKLGEDQVLLGASPEMLVRCNEGNLEYRPIAGTYPRGVTEDEDIILGEQLKHDEKERAEHIMLVDLGRNDLGRVSNYGSVEVAELMIIERYSHVMHLVSVLKSRLQEGYDCFHALGATFPAGTLTGAPKVRAMQIIDELEPTRRGAYGGAVLYFDYSGNLDSCIALRTMYVKGNRAFIQAGAGIVADSVPEKEYAETVNKARACIRAIEMAEKEL